MCCDGRRPLQYVPFVLKSLAPPGSARFAVGVVGLLLVAAGCGGGRDAADEGVSDEAVDRLGVFLRSEGGEATLWLDLGDAVWLRSSRCSDADLVGVERDGVYYPVSIHGPGVCGAAGNVHPITGPFAIDRSDGVAVTLGDATVAFARPTAISLDAAFTAGPLDITDGPVIGMGDGGYRLQLGDDHLRGVTPCQTFETSLERRGSLLATGDIRHSADCPDEEPLMDLLANRTLVAVAVGDELVVAAGPGRFLAVRPSDGEALGAAGGLDRTIHRDRAPVTGEFHALAYEVDGEPRATAEGYPFRLVLSDDGASWYADCNETNAGGRWEGGQLLVHDTSITAVGCEVPQARDLALLLDGFRLAQDDDGRWTISAGPLTIPLTPGPPVDPHRAIEAGRWVGGTIGWSPFNVSGTDRSPVSLRVEAGGRATLDTGCRQIPLDLSPGAQTLGDDDLPPSTCTLDDGAAPLDAWAASIVTAEHAGAFVRVEQLTLSGGGRSIELTAAGSGS